MVDRLRRSFDGDKTLVDEIDGLSRANEFCRAAPEKHLVHESRPALKKGEAKAETGRPLRKLSGVESGLPIADHHDGGFANFHVDALFAENLHVGNRDGLVANLESLVPSLGVAFGANANVAGIFPARIVDAAAFDAGRARKHVEQAGDDCLRALAAFRIRANEFLDDRSQLLRRDLDRALARAVAGLIAHAHADKGAQNSKSSLFVIDRCELGVCA